MTEEEIYTKIKTMYEDEKSKNFIIHLLRSFFPINKSEYLWEMPEGITELKCCITGVSLTHKNELFQFAIGNGQDDPNSMPNHMLNKMKWEIENADCFDDEGKKKEGVDFKTPPPENPLVKKLNGKVLGIGCKDSNKYMCKDAYEALLQFYQNQILIGDPKINWIIKNERAKAGITYMKEKGIITNQEEEKAVIKRVNKPNKVTLGDLGILQSLKTKMEIEEQNKK